jgi:hypothetical protein
LSRKVEVEYNSSTLNYSLLLVEFILELLEEEKVV